MAAPNACSVARLAMNASMTRSCGTLFGTGFASQIGSRRHAKIRAAQPRGGASQEDPQYLYEELKNKFGYIGAVNHKEVGVLDLYNIMQASRRPNHYRVCLNAMNLFYNFGVKLKHRELATRLLSTAMNCKMQAEAVELIKLYGTWLENPPDISLVYAVMGHFLDAGEPLVVREIAKAVREDWRMPVGAPLYLLAIEAMLRLPDNPLGEAIELYDDATQIGVRLPAPLHTRLLLESLRNFEAAQLASGTATETIETTETDTPPAEPPSSSDLPDEAAAHLRTALRVADGLARDGHLRGGANAATLCSFAWLFWHLTALPESTVASVRADAQPGGASAFLGGDWVRVLEAATENFGCQWGFAAQLPRGFFQALEASSDPEAIRLVKVSKMRFGRFYPLEH